MRYRAVLVAAFTATIALSPWQPARAASASIATFFNACPAYGGVRICSGAVPSFDGTRLDVDLSLPTTSGQHALIVMAHGFGNNKHEWESLTDAGDNADKWHWNSHWFAQHGFYVLAYTARGFRDSGTSRADEPNTPAPTFGSDDPSDPNARISLKSRTVEIRDTQWLSAMVAAAYPDLDPNRVAITGGSYGGGESWTQAAQATWTFPHDQDPALPLLHLQVAVPKYPWTDLGYSLAPNGHAGPAPGGIYSSASGSPTSELGAGNPVGVIKYSYATGFFALGTSGGTFTPEVNAWYARGVQVGDPYDAGAPGTDLDLIAQLREGLTEERSSYYQDEEPGGWLHQRTSREVAIFSISGWTDDLFPAVESFRQFSYLKALDPLWPVQVAVADIGHPRAQNPGWQWRPLNTMAWMFLGSQIGGSHRQATGVLSLPTVCAGDPDAGAAAAVAAPTPQQLARGSVRVAFTTGATLLNRKPPAPPAVDPLDPDNAQTDPAFGSVAGLPACRQSIAPQALVPTARYTAVSEPLAQATTLVGLASVEVPYSLVPAARPMTATLNARVWDVLPDGKTAFLITRGTYRIDPPGYDATAGTLTLPLFSNHWRLGAGHRIRLDLTLVDSPTFLASNSPVSVVITEPRLNLPTREAIALELTGR